MRYAIGAIVIVILLGIFGPWTLYTVDETQLVVVTRFGKIRDIHTSPGLKVKAPFWIDKVNRFDKRVLRIDTPPATLNDVEKQFLVIDAYTRYKITDVELFFEKLRTLRGAEDRIGTIVTSNLKEEVALRKRQEIVGARIEQTPEGDRVLVTETRQEILDRVLAAANREVGPKKKYITVEDARELGIDIRDELVFQIGENTLLEIEADVAGEINDELIVEIGEDFGVTLVEVRIKRADFPVEALPNIFNRMRAERERISRQTRAEGAEEDAKIRAKVDRDRAIILADAQKQASITRGEGEAKAIEIFAKALEQDPEFYAFQRSLEAYKKFLSTNTTVILSSEAELFQFLQKTDFIPVQEPESIVGSVDSTTANVWTVGGQTVRLEGATRINLNRAPDVGLLVFVEGTAQDDGVIVASQVTEGVGGPLESITLAELTVEGRAVFVDEGTDDRIGARRLSVVLRTGVVFVEATSVGDRLVANQIAEGVRGNLSTIVGNTWTVGVTDILIDGDTQVGVGADQIGADVMAAVERQGDDTLLALKIVLQRPAEPAQPDLEGIQPPAEEAGEPGEGEQQPSDGTSGELEQQPSDGTAEGEDQPEDRVENLSGAVEAFTQRWKVKDTDQILTVNEATNIQLGADQVGLAVLIGFERQADGTLLALEARIG